MKHSALFLQLCRECKVKPDDVPTVRNVHRKILRELKKGGTLNMDHWHGTHVLDEVAIPRHGLKGQLKECGTTHCYAGWIVHFGGQKGYKLADRKWTEAVNAANLILSKSNPKLLDFPDYHCTREKALAYIKREARREARP